jgi:uncharacterized protein (TIGR00375 family)
MKITADFHVHSRFSRATSRDLDLPRIHTAALVKGLQVVGTGDFSHPAWLAEIESELEAAEPGLLRLRPDAARASEAAAPASCRGPVRFLLTTEISNIYKKDGRTRKNHNLVLVPDIETARRLNRRLERIGNIRSDGRPILGLDARDLLEVVLDTSPDAYLIPAHIWTPWFSMLGSQSGFDSLVECFGDMSEHVFAVETGLSSDPAMNWRVSSLDGLTLVSNSDAHSTANLARECNRFETDLSFSAIKRALQTRLGFEGTIEFFPEHGKYHLDGHRDCGVRLMPAETRATGGRCPGCGKPLTVGVLARVEALADRPEGVRPPGAPEYRRLVPLADILAEVLQAGPRTVRVASALQALLHDLGPELHILCEADLGGFERFAIPLLPEAIRRVRAGELNIQPGFDGEYGKVEIFTAAERCELQGQRGLFVLPSPPAQQPMAESSRPPAVRAAEADPCMIRPTLSMNAEQEQALTDDARHLLIVAGPGTGKTHTLTHRIARLITTSGVAPERILALTFTTRAADEMRTRLAALCPEGALPLVATLHGFCLGLLREDPAFDYRVVDDDEQEELLADAAAVVSASAGRQAAATQFTPLRRWIMQAKQNLLAPEDGIPGDPGGWAGVYTAYQHLLDGRRLLDFEDLVGRVVLRMETDSCYARACRARYAHILVDEFQDLNPAQYRLIRSLAPAGPAEVRLCVIGDPDQSIYGFRGSDRRLFERFATDYPGARVLRLTRNYRSCETILGAAFELISRDASPRERIWSGIGGVQTIGVLELKDEHAEAEAIARCIEALLGGTGYHSLDTGRAERPGTAAALGYADIAVLARTNGQVHFLAERFRELGIPCQAASRRRVYEVGGVRELVSLLKIVSGQGTHADFERVAQVLEPRLERKTAAAFRAWCVAGLMSLEDGLGRSMRFPIPGLGRERQLRLVEFVRRVLDLRSRTAEMDNRTVIGRLAAETGLGAALVGDAQQEALARLADLSAPGDSDRLGFLCRAALQSDTDLFHPRAEKTALMSLHAAKGLEFPIVFVAGCEDGFIPLRAADDPEEERRLFYVAVTRAKQRLYLTRARRRRVYGTLEERAPSPFMQDIGNRWLEDQSPRSRPFKKPDAQMTLF